MERHNATRPVGTLILAVTVLALAACSGRTATSPAAPAARTMAQSPAGPGSVFRDILRHSRDLGPVAPRQTVSFLLLLRTRSATRQAAELAAMYDPHSPSFGHFQTARQWSAGYPLGDGPSPARVQQLQAALRRVGLSSSWRPGDASMTVRGKAWRVERLLQVRLDRYLSPEGRPFWAGSGRPVIPRRLRAVIAGVGRMSNYVRATTLAAPVDGLTPANLLTLYDIKPLRDQGFDGAGMTVAFFEIDGYKQEDFDAFTRKYHLPPMRPIIRAGPPLKNIEGEAEMDLEAVHEIAPAARLVVYNCDDACNSGAGYYQLESQMTHDTGHGIISTSVGICEGEVDRASLQAEKSAYDQAIALGESVLAASGDSGAFDCQDKNWNAAPGSGYVGVDSPASQPNVTGVGGTHVSINKDGSWYQEEAWAVAPETAGTGGGPSSYLKRPSWQHGPGVLDPQLNPKDMREVPDVSADADPVTGVDVNTGGQFSPGGGTSLAAPIWAGMMAVIDQYLRQKVGREVGFLNPALYSLAAGHPAYPPFHDVTLGTNLVDPAGPGYDMATGLGTPDAWNLARDLETYLKGGA